MDEHVEGLIEALLDGELEADEARRAREHCARCDACRESLEASQAVRAMLAEDADLGLGGSAWPDLAARIERRRSPTWRLAGALALAGSALLGVWLGAFVASGAAQSAADQDLWATLGSTLTQQSSPITIEGLEP